MCFEVEVEAEADFLRTFSCKKLFECRLSVNAFGDSFEYSGVFI